MKNSQLITVLTIFILVFYVTTMALTLEGLHTVFAAKKSKSEDKTPTDGPTSTHSNGQAESNNGAGGSKGIINPLSLPCPDGSIPMKGKCPTPPVALSDGTSGTKNKHTSDKTTTEVSAPPSETSTSTDSGSTDLVIKSLSPLPCPDGSIPMKGECPPPPSTESSHNSVSTKNKHTSDKNTETTSTPPTAIGESSSTASSSNSKQDTTDPGAKSDKTSSTSPSPDTTSDSSNTDSSKDGGTDSSSNNTPLPSIIPSNQGAGGGNTNGGTDSSNSEGSTKPSSTTSGSGSSGTSDGTNIDTGTSSDTGRNTKPSSTTSGSGSSGSSTSGSGSSTSSSSTINTNPSNPKKTPQTSVSQSAAIAATNQIINSPGSTIINQQSIKQSVKVNNEVNNIIRKNVISQSSSPSSTSSSTSSVISNLITVKLATTTSSISRNAYLPIGDVSPYHLIGGHVTANLPNNHLYVVVAQLASNNGAIQHAVVLDMIKSQISNTYITDLGSQISGTNPLTGKQDVVSDITNLFLWNNGNQQVTFVDANAVTMNLIYK
jgi:hypothetical protein